MKKLLLLTTLVMSLAAWAPALCQVDLKKGEASSTDFSLGLFHKDENGNQDWIREYDGRAFNPGIESLESYGYKGRTAYRLDLRDVIIQDEDVAFDWSFANAYGLKFTTSRLTHRLARIPAVNPSLVGTDAGANPTEGDVFFDLAPGTDFRIRRRTSQLGLNLTPWTQQKLRVVGAWWQEAESGAKQVLFRGRAPLPGEPLLPVSPLVNNRFGGALGIDRKTNEAIGGLDMAVGKSSAVSYRFVNTKLDEDNGRPLAGTTAAPPLTRIIAPTTETNSHIIKARARISDNIYFTGVQVNRNRRNRTSTLDAVGTALPRTNEVNIDSTNLSLSFFATDSLTLTGRYRRYVLDNRVPPVLVAGVADNQASSRKESSGLIEATYNGISRVFLSSSYEALAVDRKMSALHVGHEEFEHPFTSTDTNTTIWRSSVRYYPTSKLNLSGSYQRSNIDDPGYSGTPTDSQKLDAQATYMVTDNFGLYGNYNRWSEDNGQVRVPLADIPTPGVDATGQELRAAAAGQGYRNKVTTGNIGAWYAITPKLTFDANYGTVDTRAGALWIIGTDPAFLPQLFPYFAPYNADNTLWAAGLTYSFHPRWRVYGRFMNSDTTGKMLINLTTSAGAGLPVGPTWLPVDVNERRYTIGFGYDLSVAEQLLLEASVSDWEDKIDSSQSGQFSVVRFAWGHKY